jgi:flagellar protein FlaG
MAINKIFTGSVEALNRSRPAAPREQLDTEVRGRIRIDESSLTQEKLEKITDTLNSMANTTNTKIAFSMHEKTHRVIMKVQDGSTSETIREIPSKEMIRLLEHMQEFIGMFVDETR